MATQTADMADSLSDNADDLLRHAPPGYKSDDPDFRSDLGKLAKRFLDVACQRAPECEPKRARTIPSPEDKMCTCPPKPDEAVVVAIDKLNATSLPVPAAPKPPKPDAPPQGEGGTERPLARCPFPQRRKEVSEARGPSLYVGDSSLRGWFLSEKDRPIMVKWWTEGELGYRQGCVMWPGLSLGFSRVAERALISALKEFPENLQVMWMITPTLSGVNVGAIDPTHAKKNKTSHEV